MELNARRSQTANQRPHTPPAPFPDSLQWGKSMVLLVCLRGLNTPGRAAARASVGEALFLLNPCSAVFVAWHSHWPCGYGRMAHPRVGQC